MNKHQLSPNITIAPACAGDEYDVPDRFHDGYSILFDELKNRGYLINPSIGFFLDKFSTPRTILEVIEEIKTGLQTDNHQIAETCQSFFDF